ncbi:hypothetical protein PMIN03_006435 [Paraphaeosphaeria minitans]
MRQLGGSIQLEGAVFGDPQWRAKVASGLPMIAVWQWNVWKLAYEKPSVGPPDASFHRSQSAPNQLKTGAEGSQTLNIETALGVGAVHLPCYWLPHDYGSVVGGESVALFANISTTLTALVTPIGEQRELLRGIRACVTKISTLKAGRVKNAVAALEKTTHRSPLLSLLGPAGLRELVDRLEDKLEGGEEHKIETWVEKCVGDLNVYQEAEEELAEAEARIEFYELQAQNAQDLFVYTIVYENKSQKAKEAGEAFPIDYAVWLRAQPIITFDLGTLGEWLKRKKEERERYQEKEVGEKQWILVREVADSLNGKRILNHGDKEVLGL